MFIFTSIYYGALGSSDLENFKSILNAFPELRSFPAKRKKHLFST
jgi:hypothetical protein